MKFYVVVMNYKDYDQIVSGIYSEKEYALAEWKRYYHPEDEFPAALIEISEGEWINSDGARLIAPLA